MNGKEDTKTSDFWQLKEKTEILAINELFQCFFVLMFNCFIIAFTIFFSFSNTEQIKMSPKRKYGKLASSMMRQLFASTKIGGKGLNLN